MWNNIGNQTSIAEATAAKGNHVSSSKQKPSAAGNCFATRDEQHEASVHHGLFDF